MHFRRIKQLAAEGLAMTAVVLVGLVVFSRALNSNASDKAAEIPVAGGVVLGVRSVVNSVVKPTN